MKILLVDDHQMFREGVREFLKRESFCTEVVDAESVDAARSLMTASPPDLLVTDISFPESSGKELLQWTADNCPETKCLCMTMHAKIGLLRDVLSMGVLGYVTKSSGYEELVAAIRTVGSGGRYLDQLMLNKVLDHLVNGIAAPRTEADAFSTLSEREREVVLLLLEDQDPSQIGEALYISRKTVENHRSNIYRKLGVHDRLSLLRFAGESRLLH